MSFLGVYKAGATVKYRGNFHNDTGTLEDPTSPEAQCEYPDTSFNALTTPAKINSKTGHYGGSIDTTGLAVGEYIIRMAGTVATAKTIAMEFYFEIVAFDPIDAVRLGLTALPNAAAEASGGLATLSAAQASNGTIQANVHRWLTGTPNGLQSGRVDSYLGAVAAGVIAAASFAANALDAVWSTATRLLTAGTNIALAKGTGVTGFTDLDAAGIRTAVGLASANLDTQLAGKAVPGSAMTLTSGERGDIAAALLDLADGIEDGLTVKEALRLIAAAAAGKASGLGTTTARYRNAVTDDKERITAVTDSRGNRTAITYDLSDS